MLPSHDTKRKNLQESCTFCSLHQGHLSGSRMVLGTRLAPTSFPGYAGRWQSLGTRSKLSSNPPFCAKPADSKERRPHTRSIPRNWSGFGHFICRTRGVVISWGLLPGLKSPHTCCRLICLSYWTYPTLKMRQVHQLSQPFHSQAEKVHSPNLLKWNI